jgi:Phosphotransferase enzyme family
MGDEGAGVGAVMRALRGPRGEDTLPAHLAGRWGVEVRSVMPLEVGVTRVDLAGEAPWVARVFPPERPVERVEGDADEPALLAAAGIPAERPARPDPVSSLDGRPVLVTTFVAGDAPPPDRGTLARLAGLLGRVHALPEALGAAARAGGSLHHVPGYEGLPREDLALAAPLLDDARPAVPASARGPVDRLRDEVAAATTAVTCRPRSATPTRWPRTPSPGPTAGSRWSTGPGRAGGRGWRGWRCSCPRLGAGRPPSSGWRPPTPATCGWRTPSWPGWALRC